MHALDSHRVLPPARGAVTDGLVTLRDGDYFGPVVNLAARLVHLADPGQVVAPADVATVLDPSSYVCRPAGTHAVRGFTDPVEVRSVARVDGA